MPPRAHVLEAGTHAGTQARRAHEQELTLSSALPRRHEAVGLGCVKQPVGHTRLPHILCCTVSIAAEQRRLAARTDRSRRQRCREGAAGGRDGGAPRRLVHRASASLQGTPQRRRWALVARMLHRVCFELPAQICSQLPRLTLCSVLRCLFAWLFVYLFACDWPLQNTPSMARPTPHARRHAGVGLLAFAAQECVAAVCALVRRRQPRRAAAAQAHCASAYA
jgi:hypothetical protein